jgi:hypothetical protein
VFCNLLGQVRFLLPDATFDAWAAAFRTRVVPALATRSWVSFHDRVSGPLAPELGAQAASAGALDDRSLVGRFYAAPPASVELVDHSTDALWPASLARQYFAWQVVPGRFHLIEGISMARPAMWARSAS